MTDSLAEDVLAVIMVVVAITVVGIVVAFGVGALLAVAVAGFEWALRTLGVVL